jgi:hypothetical protein
MRGQFDDWWVVCSNGGKVLLYFDSRKGTNEKRLVMVVVFKKVERWCIDTQH